MKKIALLFSLLFLLCTLAAQRPIQVQTVDSVTYVVEYMPLGEAQKNVNMKIAQAERQLGVIEKQMAELVKKRDEMLQQKAAYEYLKTQLDQATTTPPPTVKAPDQSPTPPAPAKPAKKPKKKKN